MKKQKLTVFTAEETEQALKVTLLNEDQTAVFELTMFKQQYENGEWLENEEVSENFYKDLEEAFQQIAVDTEDLEGKEVELFVSEKDGRAHLKEPKSLDLTKPTLEQVGELEQGVIADVIDFDTKRIIVIDIDGVRYAKNFNYGRYHDKLEKYLISKVDEIKQKQKYKDLTGCEWSDTESIVGKNAMIEFKSFKAGKKEIPFVDLKKLK